MHAHSRSITHLLAGTALVALVGLAMPAAVSAEVMGYKVRDRNASMTADGYSGLTSWKVNGKQYLYNQKYKVGLGKHKLKPLGHYYTKKAKKTRRSVHFKYKYKFDGNNGGMSDNFNSNHGKRKKKYITAKASYRLKGSYSDRSWIKESLTIKTGKYKGPMSVMVYTDFDIKGRKDDWAHVSRKGGIQYDNGYFAKYLKPKAKIFKKKRKKEVPNSGNENGDYKFKGKKKKAIWKLIKTVKPKAYDVAYWSKLPKHLRYKYGSKHLKKGDMVFGHRFDFYVKPHQKIKIYGTKSAAAPTPTAFVGGIALLGGLAMRRSRRQKAMAS